MSKRLETELVRNQGSTDEEIVHRVLGGDVALFEVLVRRNNTRVYRAIRALLRDEGEAEDAMQAAYVLAYSKLRTFQGEARFSTWLTRIALNEALSRLRRDRRHPSVSLEGLPEPPPSSLSAPTQSPEGYASGRELAGLLERAIDRLPELYRVVFVLREIEGMDTTETASALGVSDDVVKTRLSRAKAALRETLVQMVGSAGPEAFGFHASRCDRIVEAVLRQIQALGGAS